jgi:hypothetical protein
LDELDALGEAQSIQSRLDGGLELITRYRGRASRNLVGVVVRERAPAPPARSKRAGRAASTSALHAAAPVVCHWSGTSRRPAMDPVPGPARTGMADKPGNAPQTRGGCKSARDLTSSGSLSRGSGGFVFVGPKGGQLRRSNFHKSVWIKAARRIRPSPRWLLTSAASSTSAGSPGSTWRCSASIRPTRCTARPVERTGVVSAGVVPTRRWR